MERKEVSEHHSIALVYDDDYFCLATGFVDSYFVGNAFAERIFVRVCKNLKMFVQLLVAFLKSFVLEHDVDVALVAFQERVRHCSVDPALAFACGDDVDLPFAAFFVQVCDCRYSPLIVV